MRQIVLDSAILVSAFLVTNGAAGKLLGYARRGKYRLVFCSAIAVESARALLTYTRIRKRYSYTDDDVRHYLHGIEAISFVVNPLPIPSISRDPNDDVIIGCTLAGGADIIVTRDKDLLVLKTHKHISIIAPETALAILKP
ncbi:putative toxin-antitoxin system toxin component, PIN family [Candidatus Uhrbacteria bacterium]|nr:putative toxin-antitoxin system toxin component, PIN family [Candidatus Uhrbacteria bacterium]